jgi:hypothetical protein
MNYYPDTLKRVEIFLDSEYVTEPTRKALQDRIWQGNRKKGNRFFSPYHFFLLSIVCDRLVEQDPEDRILNIAYFIDERLDNNTGDGWRYADMPPDDVMLLTGLEGISETALAMYGKLFIVLKKEEQIKVLVSVQKGNPMGNIWKTFSAMKFFEELLAEVTEIFFSHPSVQLQIGYVGMADAGGWEL